MDIKKDHEMYMQIALLTAKRSYAKRLQVGCVIVKNNSIISFGWNGMPTGYDNCCEYEVVGKLIAAAKTAGADYAVDVYPHYGSDVEATLRAGADIRHGLIGAGVYASHGYERSHIDGVYNTLKVLCGYLEV